MKEINIIGKIRKVLDQRRQLAIFGAVGAVVGVVVALCTPKEYTSEVLLAPEMSAGGLGLSSSIEDMAKSFGVDIGSSNKGMDAIYPEIYPEILTSYDFIYTLFDVKVRLKNDNRTRTYFTHMTKEVKMPFWDYPKLWLAKALAGKEPGMGGVGKADPFKMSKDDSEVCKAIAGNIGCLVDKKTNVILISVTDQDPLVAAIIADTLQNRLQAYITAYRTKKAHNDLEYYSGLYQDARAKYNKAQAVYASYCDTNQDVLLESFVAKRDELENEMQTAFNLMSQMQTQVQAARAKIQERTPAYTMIKSPKMPYKASSMSRSMIVLLFIFLALAADAVWVVFVKDFTKKKK